MKRTQTIVNPLLPAEVCPAAVAILYPMYDVKLTMAEAGVAVALEKNPISRLQEICQQWKFPLPVYREAQGTFSEFGTEVSLTLEGEAVAFHGRGRTKKTSKSKAAQEVLNYISETKAHLLEPPPLTVSGSLACSFSCFCPPTWC